MAFSKDFITLKDLFVAYRKVKVDLFYEHLDVTGQKFLTFESNLNSNLLALLNKINDENPLWPKDIDFLGGYSYAFKGIRKQKSKPQTSELLTTDSIKIIDDKTKLDFRLIFDGSIAFHLVSALWIIKVGHKFDLQLGYNVYGSRLRRSKVDKKVFFSEQTVGSFKHYADNYKAWKQKGLNAISNKLQSGESIVAMTMDIKSFYHNINPDFLLNPNTLKKVNLSKDEMSFTRQLIDALKTWSKSTPEPNNIGLPVGLSCSKVIANAALMDLDSCIESKLSPIYYGRYVDDIFLVLNNIGFKDSKDIWQHLVKATDGVFKVTSKNQLKLQLPNAIGSKLLFTSEKQKFFILKGQGGKDLLNGIMTQLSENASEWRLLSDLPDNGDLYPKILAAQDAGLNLAESLRKTDTISIRRLHFAIALRNLEAIQRNLPANEWKKQRNEYYDIVVEYILSPKYVAEYIQYYGRLIGLAVACDDYDNAQRVIMRFYSACNELSIALSNDTSDKLELFMAYAGRCFIEGALKNYSHNSVELSNLNKLLHLINAQSKQLLFTDFSNTEKVVGDLARRDLASISYKEYALNRHAVIDDSSFYQLNISDKNTLVALRAEKIRDFTKKLVEIGYHFSEIQLMFPTRPLTIPEISEVLPECISNWKYFSEVIFALRGVKFSVLSFTPKSNDVELITIPASKNFSPNIALGCFETTSNQWYLSAKKTPDVSLSRYIKVNRLVNQVIKSHEKIDYFVLPELSIPKCWADTIASRLSRLGISFIVGVEYDHHGTDKVSNTARMYLTTKIFMNKSHVVVVQEKQRPALDEGQHLKKNGLQCTPKKPKQNKDIVKHGEMCFSVLICSELTNICYRASLQGNVDAVFVLEWNRDIASFNSLIESSALDIHGYMIQVNNRNYGDSRIRAPYKKEYKRDLVRIKGGVSDFVVVGNINIAALREFQNGDKKRRYEFKPLPDGFNIASFRKTTTISFLSSIASWEI